MNSNENNNDLDSLSSKIVERVTLYKREVERLIAQGKESIFSHDLASITGIAATTVRKDFSSLGRTSGHVKLGYDLLHLKKLFDEILGLKGIWNIAIVGVGNLGKALLNFKGFKNRGFEIKCGFDIDPTVVGKKISGKKIFTFEDAERIIEQENIQMIIIAVNSSSGQDVYEKFLKLGIRAFLNFSPIMINTYDNECVYIENVDLASSLEKMSFFLDKNTCIKNIENE